MNVFHKKVLHRGFTLIELLVVIAIIGVLSSIVLASLNNARQKSRDVRRISDLKQIQLALELYFDGQGGKYPAANATDSACNNLDDLSATGKNYIPQVPRDPSSSTTCYNYATPSGETSPTTYHLGARLEDPKNNALLNDGDFDGTAYAGKPFHGKSGATSGQCNGTAVTDPTKETCYDVRP